METVPKWHQKKFHKPVCDKCSVENDNTMKDISYDLLNWITVCSVTNGIKHELNLKLSLKISVLIPFKTLDRKVSKLIEFYVGATLDLKKGLSPNFASEAVVRRSSLKKVFLEISQNSHENTCARDSFLITL